MKTSSSVTSPGGGLAPGSAGAFGGVTLSVPFRLKTRVRQFTVAIRARVYSASLGHSGVAFSNAGPVDAYVGVADAYFAIRPSFKAPNYTFDPRFDPMKVIVATYDDHARTMRNRDFAFSFTVKGYNGEWIPAQVIRVAITLGASAMSGNPPVLDTGTLRAAADAAITSVTILSR